MNTKRKILSTTRITRSLGVVLAATLVATISLNRVQAAGGDLDISFGTGGVVTTNLGAQEGAEAVAIQPDGRIVIGIKSSTSVSDFILMRYNADGTVDTSFGIGGVVQTYFLGYGGIIRSVKVDSRGRIVAAGYIKTSPSPQSDTDYALARYTPQGALDTSFGSQGKVIRDHNLHEGIGDIAIQKDGKIVVTGWSLDSEHPERFGDFAIFRLTSNGSQDLTFAFGNVVLTDFYDGFDLGVAVVLQSDGRIVVGGDTTAVGSGSLGFTSSDFALARYNTNGTLDTTFGRDGKITNSFFGNFNNCSEILIRTMPFGGEQIIAVGTISSSPSNYFTGDFGMVCYLSNGSLNPLFGAGGIVSTDLSGDRDIATCAVQQPDRKIVVAGRSSGYSGFVLTRYNSNGSLDTGFGNGGQVITPIGGLQEATGLALTPEAEIVAVGYAIGDIGLAKYLP